MYAPEEMKGKRAWVNADDGSKRPLYQSLPVSVSDPRDWTSFSRAVANVEDGFNDYVGFVFDGSGIVGIDIDKGFDEDGLITDLGYDIVTLCHSTTEISKSGRGFHIYLKGTLPFNGANNHDGVEIYSVGRFFIYTGRTIFYPDLIENQQAIDEVVRKYFPEETRKTEGGSHGPCQYQPVRKFVNGKIVTTYPPIHEGFRNQAMASLAGQYKSRGLDETRTYKKLIEINGKACNPPLEDDEIRAVVHSIYRYRT